MFRLTLPTLALVIAWLLIPSTALAQWRTIEEESVSIYFQEQNEDQARRVLALYRKNMPLLERDFAHKPHHAHLVVYDNADIANGYAFSMPHNNNTYFLHPFLDKQLLDQTNHMDLVVRHEALHLYHGDAAKGFPQKLRQVFGRVSLSFPYRFSPLWFVEGLATYHETNHSTNSGRGANGYFDALMRLTQPYGFRNVYQTTYSQKGYLGYLYGYYFFAFLHQKYGRDAIFALMVDFNGNILPTMLDASLSDVLNSDLATLWAEYIAFLDSKFTQQRNAITALGNTPGTQLTQPSAASPRPQYTPSGALAYLWQDPYTGEFQLRVQHQPAAPTSTQVARQSKASAQDRIVARAINPFGDFAFHPKSGLLYSVLRTCRQKDDWNKALFFDLHYQPVNATTSSIISRCQRYNQVRWHPDGNSFFALRQVGGTSQLHQMTTDGLVIEPTATTTEGTIIGGFALSPDGNRIALTRKTLTSGWNIAVLDRRNNTYKTLEFSDAIDTDPVFTPDGAGVVFSSNQGGVYNLWYRSLTSNTAYSITNTLGAAFEPSFAPNGDVVYTQLYYDNTFAVHTIAPASRPHPTLPPVVRVEHPIAPPLPLVASSDSRPYSLFRGLGPTSWLPLFGSSNRNSYLGFLIDGSDILSNHSWSIGAYATRWHRLTPRHNYEYDLFYTFRNGIGLSVRQREVPQVLSEDRRSGILATINQKQLALSRTLYHGSSDAFDLTTYLIQEDYQLYTSSDSNTAELDQYQFQTAAISLDWERLSQGSKGTIPFGFFGRGIYESLARENSTGARTQGYFRHAMHLWRPFALSYQFKHGQAKRKQDSFQFGNSYTTEGNLPSASEFTVPMPGYTVGDPLLHAARYTYANLAPTIALPLTEWGAMIPAIGVISSYAQLKYHYLQLEQPRFASYSRRDFASASAELQLNTLLVFSLHLPVKLIYSKGFAGNGVETYAFAIGTGYGANF